MTGGAKRKLWAPFAWSKTDSVSETEPVDSHSRPSRLVAVGRPAADLALFDDAKVGWWNDRCGALRVREGISHHALAVV